MVQGLSFLSIAYDETDPRSLHRQRLPEIQRYRFRELIRRVWNSSPFYSKMMKKLGLAADDFHDLSDLQRFPFTTKDDLRLNSYPYGGDFLSVPLRRIAWWHMTSGSTGVSTVGAYTREDVRTWSRLMARCLKTAGVTSSDIVANGYGYGLFTGGMGFHLGCQYAGSRVIPWGSGRSEALARALKDFKATVFTGTPSFQLLVSETLSRLGISPDDLSLRLSIPGAEVMTAPMLDRIESGFALDKRGGGARVIYGLTEAMGPGVAQECPDDHHSGMHIWTDHFIAEIVKPDSDEVLGFGEEGELVITPLTKKAMPLIRNRTRDITSLSETEDEIPFPRISLIKGRIDDVIFFKGAKIFPSAVHEAVLSFPEVGEFQIVIDKTRAFHSFKLKVETKEPSEELASRIASAVASVSFVTPEVEFVPYGSLPRYEGKARREIVME